MEYSSIILNLFLVIFLVLLNGFFVAAEFAIVKVRSSRIDALVQEGTARAKFGANLVHNLDSYLSVSQLGITLASLGLGWIGEPAVAKFIYPVLSSFELSNEMVHTISFAIAFSFITALHIVLGELAPKSLAIQKAEAVTLWVAIPMIACYKLMYPFVWVLNHIAAGILKLFGIKLANDVEAAHSEDEIRSLMEESHKQGYINQTELTLVDNIFDFAERNAREVMIPRTDMVCLYTEDSFEKNLEVALTEQLTRFPICAPDKDNIIGFVHIKDLFAAVASGEKPEVQSIARKIIAVPESMPLSNLLKLLQKHRSQIALVVDEYGGTSGMVTVEDILEEIVGEIQDEFDEERPTVEKRTEKLYSLDAKMLLDDVNDMFGTNIEEENIDTIGGWLSTQVDTPPRVGQKANFGDDEFFVEEVDRVRITRVLVKLNHTVDGNTDI